MITPHLRWLAEPGTSTRAPRLQMRDPQTPFWHDIPVVVDGWAAPPAPSAAPEVLPAALVAQIVLSAGLTRRRIMDARSALRSPTRHELILLDDAMAHIDNIMQAAQRLSPVGQDRAQEPST